MESFAESAASEYIVNCRKARKAERKASAEYMECLFCLGAMK